MKVAEGLGVGQVRAHKKNIDSYIPIQEPFPLAELPASLSPSSSESSSSSVADALTGLDLIYGAENIQKVFPFISDDCLLALHSRRGGYLSAQQLGTLLLSEAKRDDSDFDNAESCSINISDTDAFDHDNNNGNDNSIEKDTLHEQPSVRSSKEERVERAERGGADGESTFLSTIRGELEAVQTDNNEISGVTIRINESIAAVDEEAGAKKDNEDHSSKSSSSDSDTHTILYNRHEHEEGNRRIQDDCDDSDGDTDERDLLHIPCKVVVNASGPWVNEVNRIIQSSLVAQSPLSSSPPPSSPPTTSTSTPFELPLSNDLHAKVMLRNLDQLIPAHMPLMIFNDDIQLPWTADEKEALMEMHTHAPEKGLETLLSVLPEGVHCRPEGNTGEWLVCLWEFMHLDLDVPDPPPRDVAPLFNELYPEIVLRGLSAMIPEMKYGPRQKCATNTSDNESRVNNGDDWADRDTSEKDSNEYDWINRLDPRSTSVDGGFYCKSPKENRNRPIIGKIPPSYSSRILSQRGGGSNEGEDINTYFNIHSDSCINDDDSFSKDKAISNINSSDKYVSKHNGSCTDSADDYSTNNSTGTVHTGFPEGVYVVGGMAGFGIMAACGAGELLTQCIHHHQPSLAKHATAASVSTPSALVSSSSLDIPSYARAFSVEAAMHAVKNGHVEGGEKMEYSIRM